MRALGIRQTVCDLMNRGSPNGLATGEAAEVKGPADLSPAELRTDQQRTSTANDGTEATSVASGELEGNEARSILSLKNKHFPTQIQPSPRNPPICCKKVT